MTDKQTLDIYNARAEDYATKFCGGDEPNAKLRRFMDHLPEKGRVLDLGCGPGQASGIMANAGFDVTAVDASEEMVRIAALKQGVTAQLGTFDDLTVVDTYDGIYANFSLLHADASDLPRYVGAISKALKQNGIFHVGMKLGTGMHRDDIGRRYTYVTKEGLTALLENAGLAPVYEDTGEEVGMAGTMDPWIVMHAVKHA